MPFGRHNNHSETHPRLAGCKRRAPRSGLRGGRNRRYTLVERFWARVRKDGPEGCWIFEGYPANPAGHIHTVREDGSRVYAHRVSWEIHNGRPVPDGLRVMHSCDVPACVNPDHLSVGTQADNIHDSIHKGRFHAWGLQKLNANQVREIRALAAQGSMTHKEIGRLFGVARNTVSQIVTRKNWKHVA